MHSLSLPLTSILLLTHRTLTSATEIADTKSYYYCYCPVHVLFLFIYLFLDRGEGWEKEGEKHQCVVACCMPPMGTWPTNQACALNLELNQQPFGSQTRAQSTEPHQPGHPVHILDFITWFATASTCIHLLSRAIRACFAAQTAGWKCQWINQRPAGIGI